MCQNAFPADGVPFSLNAQEGGNAEEKRDAGRTRRRGGGGDTTTGRRGARGEGGVRAVGLERWMSPGGKEGGGSGGRRNHAALADMRGDGRKYTRKPYIFFN